MSCSLVYTDNRFIFASRSYPEIPLLVDSTFHFVAPVCDYLRNLVLHEQLKTSSAKTYAEYIQQFWNFLEKNNIAFSEVTDTELLTWLNQQRNRGNKDYVVAARCDAIFDMYCWLQIKGYVKDMVRIPNHNADVVFEPLLSSKTARPSRFRPSRYGVVSAIRPNGGDADSIQPTPTSDELSKLYIVADNPNNFDLTERNQLLIDWYGQTGVRRLEVQNLTVDQIPDWGTIDTLRANGHAYEMRITKTKGDKSRHIGVLPHLLERTREWIEGGRADIINRFKRKNSAYVEPKEIFISNKTGEAISLKAITNLFTSFFSKANVDGHGHRIRAYYLNNLLQAEVDAAMATLTSNGGTSSSIDWELIMRKVAERAGHQNLDTLRKYVTILKKKYHRISGRDDLVTVDQLLKIKKQQLDLIDHQISQKKAELAALLVDKKENE